MHYPDFESFSRLAEGAKLLPVYRRLVADSLTPVSAFHKLDKGPCACLFESVVGGEKVGRYSFLAANPFMQLEARGRRITIVTPEGTDFIGSDDPLDKNPILSALCRQVAGQKALFLAGERAMHIL